MVYFIKAGEHIKIGFTEDDRTFKVRLSSYKTSNPFEIEVINLIEGFHEEETNILNYFIKYHCRGEWFYYNQEIVDYAMNPYTIPESNFQKPLHEGNKIITENIDEILRLYAEGTSLKVLQEMFGVPRSRLTKYIPEDLRREKNEWFKLNRRTISPANNPVLCIETNEEYISLSEASRITGISKSCIGKVCRGTAKKAKGFTFKYLKTKEE